MHEIHLAWGVFLETSYMEIFSDGHDSVNF